MQYQIIPTTETPLTPSLKVRRPFPSGRIKDVNPFVFFDHFGPAEVIPSDKGMASGTGAHPHRGFCTFTYLFSGEFEHKDSYDNHGIVGPGGAQWMKAGSGIMHDEKPSPAFAKAGGILNGLQLWINLPSKRKDDTPEYESLLSEDVPEIRLPGDAKLRLLIGKYKEQESPITAYTPMMVAHLQLSPNIATVVDVNRDHQHFLYLPKGKMTINSDINLDEYQGLYIKKGIDTITLSNTTEEQLDVILLTGKPIEEPIAMHGPFVMENMNRLQEAYVGYQEGKYGEITI